MQPEETIRILGVEPVLGLLRDIALNVFAVRRRGETPNAATGAR
jgi:hypothetical protein